MTPYIVHRIHREELPAKPDFDIPPMVAIKFFPIKAAKANDPILLQADSPEEAFALAALAFPSFRSSLAVQPLTEYQNDLARFAELKSSPRNESRRILTRPGAKGPRYQSENSLG